MMDKTYFGNTMAELLIAAGITAVSIFLLMVLLRFVINRLEKKAEGSRTHVDDFVIHLLSKTHPVFLVVTALTLGTRYLELSDALLNAREIMIIVAFVLQGGLWINAGISFWLTHMMREKMASDASTATAVAVLGFLARVILWSAVLLLALDNLGIDVTAFIAGLGVGGIAVALATQKVLGDLFASLSIVLDKPFVIGDFIVVDEHMGTVETIGLKTTKIRSLTGEQLIMSNSDLLDSRIHNFKRMEERRIVFTLGVPYDTSHERVSAVSTILRDIVQQRGDTRFDRAHFKQFTPTALEFEVVYFVLTSDFNTYMDIQEEINLAIHRRFHEEGIDFAVPTQRLFLHRRENGNGSRIDTREKGSSRGH